MLLIIILAVQKERIFHKNKKIILREFTVNRSLNLNLNLKKEKENKVNFNINYLIFLIWNYFILYDGVITHLQKGYLPLVSLTRIGLENSMIHNNLGEFVCSENRVKKGFSLLLLLFDHFLFPVDSRDLKFEG